MGDWRSARSILVVRLDSLGDVLMTTPALRALKYSLPGVRLTLLTSPAGAAAVPLIPEIDAALVYQAPWMKAASTRLDSRLDLEQIERLRQGGYDAAVIFTVFSQNSLPAALLLYLAGIPLRLAYCRENPYQLLTDWAEETDTPAAMRHEVRRQLDLVGRIGAAAPDERLSLQPPADAAGRVAEILAQAGLECSRPWLVIHPGASAASRRYSPEGYAEVAAGLVRQGFQVVFTGQAGEQALIQSIQAQSGVQSLSLTGRLSLGELAALIQMAPLLICNNTGPAHMAAALGTPVVDLYALTNPQHTPWQVPQRVLYHDVDCKYCYKSVCPLGHHHCLRLLAPSAVIQAALDLLAEVEQTDRELTHGAPTPG